MENRITDREAAARIRRDQEHRSARRSGIELLKIAAMCLIVISHVVQTLSTEPPINISYSDYVLSLGSATDNVQHLILAMFTYFGSLGNMVFFVCSAWFLVERAKSYKRKILQLLADVWVVSICMLAVVLVLRRGHLRGWLMLQAVFPTLFATNWFTTCYILFLAIHPFLNRIIRQVSQRTLLRIACVLLFLYSASDYLNHVLRHYMDINGFFFSSSLIVWVMMYFIIAYIKLYTPKTASSVRANILMSVVGFLGVFGVVLLANIIGKKIAFFNGLLLVWNSNCNPFMLMLVIGVFNLARTVDFHSGFVNYISKFTLFIYIIHENLLFRRIYRPAIWQYIYLNYGYSHVLLAAICFAAALFAASLLAGMIYYYSLRKLVQRACDRLYPALRNLRDRIENRLLKLQ